MLNHMHLSARLALGFSAPVAVLVLITIMTSIAGLATKKEAEHYPKVMDLAIHV